MTTLILSVLFALPTHAATLNIDDLKTIAVAEAVDHNLDSRLFLAVIDCEDPGWIVDKQSEYIDKKGHREQSYGLMQINLPAHPDITYAEAINPYFALHWAAGEWQAGRQYQWTCWRRFK